MTESYSSAAPEMKASSPGAIRSPAQRIAAGLGVAIEILLTCLLLFLPAAFGATAPWSEAIAVFIAAAIGLCVALRIVLSPPRIPLVAAFAMAAFLALSAFQLVPLSRASIQAISPQTDQVRADLIGDLPDARETLGSAPLSFYPWATKHDLRLVLMSVAVLSAVVCVYRDASRIRRLLWTIALIGAAMAVLAIAQDVTGAHAIYWRVGLTIAARSGTFVNHSHFAQFMNLSIGSALGLLLVVVQGKKADEYDTLRWPKIVLLSAIIVLGLVTVCLSLSRGGMIAIAAAGGVTTLVLLSRQNLRRLGAVMVILAIVSLSGLLYYGFDGVYDRMVDRRGIAGRLQMVRDTGVIISRFPMSGIGLGTFQWVYPSYDHTNTPAVASHLENEYVQVTGELGWPGLAIVLLFVTTVWVHYVRAVRHGGPAGIAAIGLGYGLIAVMVHSLSDFGQHVPAAGCLSAAVCGLILNLGATRARPMSRGAMIIPALIMLASAGWAVAGAEAARSSEKQWSQAQALADALADKDWDGTPEEFAELLPIADAAVAADPGDAHHRYWAACYHWYAISQQVDETTGRIATTPEVIAEAQRVVAMLNEARRRCPTYGSVYAMLGQIEFNYFARPIGVTHLHTAARLDPNDPTTCFLAGKVDARRGKFDSAEPMLRRAVDLDDTLIHDVIHLALDQLHRPELAIHVAEHKYNLMLQLYNAMLSDPAGLPQALIVFNRAIDLLEQKCQDPATEPIFLASLASYRSGQGRHADAEKYYALALQRDSSQLSWRIGHVDELVALGRFEEALAEARTAQRLYPASPEAKKTLEKLLGPTTAQ